MIDNKRCAAVVLAAGRGKRMGADRPKQFLELAGKPVICYCLDTMENSLIDEIVLVTGEEEIAFCRDEIVGRYGYRKVTKIIPGGAERYQSVALGLRAVENCDYVFIHDGARPFVDAAMLTRLADAVKIHGSAVAAMPVKDTVKIADKNAFAVETPERSSLWQMQTPQTFAYGPIREAYEKLLEDEAAGGAGAVTDDAQVMERYGSLPVKLVEGSYRNMKITTPEDLKIAEALLS
ncbi:MAG: 2-C-methyl-D-erythritol 4-phosphate cytidylyltransferase [Lachnospiraceae bacterium]|nr:2-C-methyl-D-erythritol 4-phosphate cytidylyltransferase [Lachnospiraceae bacterium]